MAAQFPDVIINLHLLFISLHLNSRFLPSSNLARTNPVLATSTSTPSHYVTYILLSASALILPSFPFRRSVNGRTGLWQWSTTCGLGSSCTRMLGSERMTTCLLLRWRRLHLLLWRMSTPSAAPAWGIQCRAENSSNSSENHIDTQEMCFKAQIHHRFHSRYLKTLIKSQMNIVRPKIWGHNENMSQNMI